MSERVKPNVVGADRSRLLESRRGNGEIALDVVMEEFRAWLAPLVEAGRAGTHDARLVIDNTGRVTLLVRPPWRNVGAVRRE